MGSAVLIRGGGDNIVRVNRPGRTDAAATDPGTPNTNVALWAGPVHQADTVVQGMGINVGNGAVYVADTQRVADRVANIGFRHVRFPRVEPGQVTQRAIAAALHANGVKGTGQADDYRLSSTAQRVNEMLTGWPVGFCDGVSTSNEPNPSAPLDWLVDTPADDPDRTFTAPVSLAQLKRETTAAWNAVQAGAPNPAAVGVRPPAPASRGRVTWWDRMALVNPWTGITNEDDIHAYQAGWTPTGNATLEYREAARAIGGDRPCICSECGCHQQLTTLSTHKPTPAEVAAYLMPRYPFELLDPAAPNALFRRMYFFQLFNEPGEGAGTTADHEAAFGFYEDDHTTLKPHGQAMKNLIARFADPGPAHTPTAPRVAVAGGDVNLVKRLYQRRNGTYILQLHRKNVTGWSPAAWVRTNPSAGYVALPAAQNITVTLGAPAPVTVYTPSVSATPTTATQTTDGVTIALRENVVLVEIGSPTAAVTPPAPASGTYTFESSSVEGGGFQNAVAVSPFLDGNGNRPYLLGADVSGPFRSTNRGALWTPVNNGSATNSMRVADLMWSDETPGKAYMLEDGGLHVATDWGVTWAKRAGAVNADANGARTTPEHPRQTGNLLGQDNTTATKYLWVGTETLGVRQSIDDGATWRATILPGHRVTSLAVDPNNRDRLYVTVNRGTAAQNGLWRIDNARATTMTATKVDTYPGTLASPVGPEELAAVNVGGTTQVYVAAHTSGMLQYTPSTGAWATRNNGLVVNGTAVYQAVTADPTDPAILYCGHWHPASRQAIYRSANGGTTWAAITGPNPVTAPATGPFIVDWTMFGTTTPSWLRDIEYHSFAGPNADWLASQLAVDPDVPTRVLAVGRGGCWWGTLEGANRRWQPANHGLLVTVCMAVAVDDLTPGRVLLGNMDYTAFYSADNLANAFQAKHPDSASTGDVVTFDMAPTTGPSTAFYGASERGSPTGAGAVYSTTTPQAGTGTHWVNESAGAFNSDVPALAVGRNAAGTRVILASVSQVAGGTVGGLWRKVGTVWTQHTSAAGNPFGLGGATTAATNMGCLRFRRNSPTCYALDDSALWRTDDAGATWVQLLTGVSATYGTYNALELDPTNPDVVYVSAGGTVRRVDNAATSTGPGATVTTTLWAGNAGNVAVRADGAEMFINVRDGRLMRSTTFRTATSQAAAGWVDVATPFFRANSGNIRSLVVSADGVVMTADNGSGALRGYQL